MMSNRYSDANQSDLPFAAWSEVQAWWTEVDRVDVAHLTPEPEGALRSGPAWKITITPGQRVTIKWIAYNERGVQVRAPSLDLDVNPDCLDSDVDSERAEATLKPRDPSAVDTPCTATLSFVSDSNVIERSVGEITVEPKLELNAKMDPEGDVFLIVGEEVTFQDESEAPDPGIKRHWIVNEKHVPEDSRNLLLRPTASGTTSVARVLSVTSTESTTRANADTATALVHVVPRPRPGGPWGPDERVDTVLDAPAEVRVEVSHDQLNPDEGVEVEYGWWTDPVDLERLTVRDDSRVEPDQPTDSIRLPDSGLYRLTIEYDLRNRSDDPKQLQRNPDRHWFRVHERVSWKWTWASGAFALAGGASVLWFQTRANAHYDDYEEFTDALQLDERARAWDDYATDISRRDLSWGVFWTGVTAAAVTWYWRVRRPQERNRMIDDGYENKSNPESARFELQPAADGMRLGLSMAY